MGTEKEETEGLPLPSHLFWVWQGFLILHSQRERATAVNYSGMVELFSCPIKITDVESYLTITGVTDYNIRKYFLRLIVALDSEYLSYVDGGISERNAAIAAAQKKRK